MSGGGGLYAHERLEALKRTAAGYSRTSKPYQVRQPDFASALVRMWLCTHQLARCFPNPCVSVLADTSGGRPQECMAMRPARNLHLVWVSLHLLLLNACSLGVDERSAFPF